MGRANGSRECAPDDRLRETHHLSNRKQLMGFASLYPSYGLRNEMAFVMVVTAIA
jgi:hypothetical protein